MAGLVLPEQSPWSFGARSEEELMFGGAQLAPAQPTHPKLQAVTRLALAISAVDFGIYDGWRSHEETLANVAKGASRTDHSKHQDGLAIDAVPYLRGSYSWAPLQCFKVAKAHQQASRFLRIPIIWGGVWDRQLAELGQSLQTEHVTYCERFKLRNPGREPLVDLVHFQLVVPHAG
jgi:peptidoglycan L-alanyl-D-glutamate endopeptidase CwlK